MESDLKLYPFKPIKTGDIPKQGDVSGLAFNYKPLFLSGSAGYDTSTGSSFYQTGVQIPFLEKYNLGIGVSGFNANYGTQQGTQNAYGTSPYLSVGYGNFNQNGSGVNAGINYTYGKTPQFNISYQRRF